MMINHKNLRDKQWAALHQFGNQEFGPVWH